MGWWGHTPFPCPVLLQTLGCLGLHRVMLSSFFQGRTASWRCVSCLGSPWERWLLLLLLGGTPSAHFATKVETDCSNESTLFNLKFWSSGRALALGFRCLRSPSFVVLLSSFFVYRRRRSTECFQTMSVEHINAHIVAVMLVVEFKRWFNREMGFQRNCCTNHLPECCKKLSTNTPIANRCTLWLPTQPGSSKPLLPSPRPTNTSHWNPTHKPRIFYCQNWVWLMVLRGTRPTNSCSTAATHSAPLASATVLVSSGL